MANEKWTEYYSKLQTEQLDKKCVLLWEDILIYYVGKNINSCLV